MQATSFGRALRLPTFLICDVHFEKGGKTAQVSTNAQLKNRLSRPVELTFSKLFVSPPGIYREGPIPIKRLREIHVPTDRPNSVRSELAALTQRRLRATQS